MKTMSRERICVECKKDFMPVHHGGTKQFCSYRCSNLHKWKTRDRKPSKVVVKQCIECGKDYLKNPKYSLSQWNRNKFCSAKCSGEYKSIKDGLTNSQRLQKRKGASKKGSEEWIEKIKARTTEGMMKPDVQEKLHKPRQPMTIENRIIRSDALVGMMPANLTLSNNGSFAHVHRGEYECSKGSVYFRSKWEANYALYLDFLIKQGEIKDWEFESETFFFENIKLGTRSYRPDFKVFNPDDSVEYHEVKGYMDARSKTKLKRMAKYFPDVKLILIERTFYMDMVKKMKGIINFNK
jgi:hypothetical protein